MRMKSFYPKGNWVKRKSGIKESVESLIKWAFEKTVRKSWQNRWIEKYRGKRFGVCCTNLKKIGKRPDTQPFYNEMHISGLFVLLSFPKKMS